MSAGWVKVKRTWPIRRISGGHPTDGYQIEITLSWKNLLMMFTGSTWNVWSHAADLQQVIAENSTLKSCTRCFVKSAIFFHIHCTETFAYTSHKINLNKGSDRSMQIKLPVLLWHYDRTNNRPSDDRTGHKKVSLFQWESSRAVSECRTHISV